MSIIESVTVTPLSAKGSVISAANFGINLVLGYERFGTLPWEKFDEIQSQVGAQIVRFPGGAEAERLFDYANYNATSAIADNGDLRQLISTDAFLDYCIATGTRATIDLPVAQLLTAARYGGRDFDASKADEVRAYIDHILEKVGPQGVATFELGNEYESYMTSQEYGRVASALALITRQEIDKYYAAHPDCTAPRPEIAVQVWGQSVQGTYSLSDLANRNGIVMAEFNAAELASVTAVTSHFYYNEGANAGKPNYHTYDNIANSVGYSLAMMTAWSTQTGRPIDSIFSEWNLNLNDSRNYGLQQVPILLELFSTMVAGGVDQMDFWSTMYHPTSLGNFRGELQAAGTLFQLMSHELIGMKSADVPVASDNYDIHAFTGGGKAVMFVSSLIDDPITLKMDLAKYLGAYQLVAARMMQVDLARADGIYKGMTGLAPWEEADAPIVLTAQNLNAVLGGSVYNAALGAHETLVLEFVLAPTLRGSLRADTLSGDDHDNRINGLASADLLNGFAGDDSLFGSTGNDTLWGGDGGDRLWGGAGRDILQGGRGDDTLEGMDGVDLIHGGEGNDDIAGGGCKDILWGDGGADGFVFRQGEAIGDIVADFSNSEGDFLIYDGDAVTAESFQLEVRTLPGIGDAAQPELLVRLAASGKVLWTLQDAGDLTGLHLLDASTGHILTL